MRKLHWLLVGVLAFLMVACGAPPDPLESLPTLAPTTEPSVLNPPPEVAAGGSVQSGRLAYVGSDRNIYVLAAGSDEPLVVTDDAVPVDGGQGRVYESPTWSRGGWLSFVGAELSLEQPLNRVIYALRPGEDDDPRELFRTSTGTYEYGYWSPAECSDGEACGRFTYLIFRNGFHELHMAEVNGDSDLVTEDILGVGSRSFYYSWAPDGERMLWLRAGSQLDVVDVNDVDSAMTVPAELGFFNAPWWSPVDERWLLALAGEGGNQLVVLDGEEQKDLTGSSGLFNAFAWAPDGQSVAYVEGETAETYPFFDGALKVLAADGSQEVVLEENQPIFAFFWAPDSQQLAYVVLTRDLEAEGAEQAGARPPGNAAPAVQQAGSLAWYVADISTGESRELVQFTPTNEQLYIYQFFDQFAQSHTPWSPDSSQLVYSEVLSDGQEAITVVDVESDQPSPTVITQGTLAIFSFE